MGKRIVTGYAVIRDRAGYRISYTFDEIDEKGNLKVTNEKRSFIVIDESTLEGIEKVFEMLEDKAAEERVSVSPVAPQSY